MNIDLDAPYLPKNFIKKESIRFGRPGTAKAKISTFYIDKKNGQEFKTKGQLQIYLGDQRDLSIFDYRNGTLDRYLIKKNLRKSKSKQLQPPLRQHLNLIKQKVNVLKTQPTSKVNEIKFPQPIPEKPKPRQVFWEKRLGQFKPNSKDDELNLPKNIKIFGPEVDNQTAVRSIAAALQLSNQGVVGQIDSKVLDKNPCVFINPDQPLVQALVITDEDIRKQEERVLNARKKLENAYKRDDLVN